MNKVVKTGAFIIVLAGAGYYFRVPLSTLWTRLQNVVLPCSAPIEYSLGQFDTKFGISKTNFLAAVAQAEALWEKAIDKQLFEYTDEGALKINLIYDTRQQATEQLQKIGVAVSDTRASYDNMKEKYATLQAQYKNHAAAFESRLSDFNQRQEAYNQEVEQWNRKGGAPKATYDQLQAQQQSLKAEAAELKRQQAALNEEVADINALVTSLNEVGAHLNLNVDTYNKIGASRGEEFEEALYRSSVAGTEIDIYQYDNRAKLVRVLAHELGHALGLDHVDDSKAIMYRLNSGTSEALTAADIAAVKGLCHLK